MIKIKQQNIRADKLAIAAWDGEIGVRFGESFYYRDGHSVIKICDCRAIVLAEWFPPSIITPMPWVKMKKLLYFDNDTQARGSGVLSFGGIPSSPHSVGRLPNSNYFYTKWHMEQYFLVAGKNWDENDTCSSRLHHICAFSEAVYVSAHSSIGFDPRVLDGFIPTREKLIEILREVQQCNTVE